MGRFRSPYSNRYILVCVKYVRKWVEAITCIANDASKINTFLKNNVFARFNVPEVLTSDGRNTFSINILKCVCKIQPET